MTNYFDQLTKGALGHILEGRTIQDPILQMLAFKNMPTDNNRRYRLVLSDGAYSYQCCIIMGELANKVENGEFDRYCLLKISRYMLNEIQGRQVIVLVDPKLLVRGTTVNEKLGDPVPFGNENAPPLSDFAPNYHVTAQSDMDVEFSNDPFSDLDTNSNNRLNQDSAAKRMKNDRGQSNNRSFASSNTARTLNPTLACPISALSPYTNKWLIKGRCTAKTAIRTWNNAKGEGYLFSFDLQDGSSDIRLTAFKAECDKFFEMIKVGQVYLVSRGQVKNANRQFTRSTSEYEITISQETIIELCNDADDCPAITYNFVPIDQLNTKYNGFADIIGILKDIGDVETFNQKKTNREMIKRDIRILDQSGSEVAMTIWGDQAVNFTGVLDDVVVARGVKVSDFNNLSLSLTSNSTLEINPEIDQALELAGWYNRVKDTIQTNNLTNKNASGFVAKWGNLIEINQANIQGNESTVVLQTKATIHQMGKTNMYKACGECNKKLTDLNNGFFRCDKCQKETDKFSWRIILSFSITDHTKSIWVQAFHEEAIKLLDNKDIEQLGQLHESNPNDFDDLLKASSFKSFIFKLRARMEHFNDDTKIRTSASGISPINYADYGKYLLETIKNS